MAIWDSLRQDPMSAMILMQGLNNLTGSMSKQNLPPRGGYVPGYGQQQGGGMEDMLPQMLRMQQMQAQQANMQADNELQRKQFEYAQQTAAQKAAAEQQRMEAVKRAVPGIVAATGQPAEVVEALLLGGVDSSNPLAQAVGDRSKTWSGAPGERRFDAQGNVIADNPALLEVTPSGFADRRAGQYFRDGQMHADAMGRSQAGATRVSNPVTITQDTLAAEMAKTPAAMFRKVADAAYAAQSGLDATRSIYELAKQNGDLFGPGMQLKADATKAIEAAKNVVSSGGQPSPEQARMLAVAKAVEVRQVNSAISKLRDIGGNDTEKEYERVLKAIPGLETSLPTHEAVFIQEKTAADYLTGMQEYVAQKTAAATQDRSLGITTVDDAISEYKRMNPLGEQLAKNLQAVMQANGLAAQPSAGPALPDDADVDDVAQFYNKKVK